MKVVVCTLQQINAHDDERLLFNAAVTANWTTYAHALVDLGARFPDDTDATYFNTDNLHFKDAAHAIIAQLFDAAIATVN